MSVYFEAILLHNLLEFRKSRKSPFANRKQKKKTGQLLVRTGRKGAIVGRQKELMLNPWPQLITYITNHYWWIDSKVLYVVINVYNKYIMSSRLDRVLSTFCITIFSSLLIIDYYTWYICLRTVLLLSFISHVNLNY